MNKIISLFIRDFENNPALVTREISEGADWVIKGEGIATRKWDGTACIVMNGKLYARYGAKHGNPPPYGAIPCQPECDPVNQHWPHWVEVKYQAQYKYHRLAYNEILPDGTYELCGPHFQSNPERFEKDCFIRHGEMTYDDVPRDYDSLKLWFVKKNIEGIVWHHPDGRMVKIKRKDFGLIRTVDIRNE